MNKATIARVLVVALTPILLLGCAAEPSSSEEDEATARSESAFEGPLSSSSSSTCPTTNANVDAAKTMMETMNTRKEDFTSVTFYRLTKSGSIHVYLGVRLVRKLPGGKTGEHLFTLGLSDETDLTDFKNRIKAGTLEKDASQTIAFTDYDKASKAISGAIDIHKGTIYKSNDFAFYGGMIATPLLGRPCANVSDDIMKFLGGVK